MEMGETIEQARVLQSDDKCVICSTKHNNPKKESIESVVSKSGWERKRSMADVFDKGDPQRMTIYPKAKFPPPYPTEGHHCIAFTSFIKKGKDECLRLNHFLHEVGFRANQPANIIQLPDRLGKVAPNANPSASWPSGVRTGHKSYWVSIDLDHPLQLHLGRHRGSYFKASDRLYRSMLVFFCDAHICKDETMQQLKAALKETIKGAVNHAFTQVAAGAWQCHPEHLSIARNLYGKAGSHSTVYSTNTNKQKKTTGVGYPGARATPGIGQTVSLATTPF